jgi:hypothetical protein
MELSPMIKRYEYSDKFWNPYRMLEPFCALIGWYCEPDFITVPLSMLFTANLFQMDG